MTRSMTAFARKESSHPWGTLTIELRSVNHRYLDISPRLPEELRVLEPQIRDVIQKTLNRGKVEVNVRYQPEQQTADEILLNEELIKQLALAAGKVETWFTHINPVNALEVMRWPGVMQTPKVEAEELHAAVLALLDDALKEFLDSRQREGDKLQLLIEQRCDGIDKIVEQVKQLIPEIKQGWREKLYARLAEFRGEVDENRLEQEMIIMAQKIDVEEEIDRLIAHVNEVRRVLQQNKPVGRRLDFLMQELNREANTLGSKSTDARTGSASVDLKVFIEQMREQVQNIE